MTITINHPSGILTTTAKVDASGIAPLGSGHGAGNVFQGENMFLDISKTVAFRKSNYYDYDAADLDAKGWPVRIPSGSTHLKLYLYANAESQTTGEYLLRWKSDVDLTLTAASGATLSNVSWDGASGTADLTLTGDGEIRFALSGGGAGDLPGFGGVQVLPKRAFPNAGGLTGVQLSDAGRNWNPDYLDLWKIPDANGRSDRPFFFARFMDLNHVNYITGSRDTADVKTLDHAQWNIEIPPALGVEFAQYAQPAHIWWCFPNRSTDAYQQTVMGILKGATAYSKIGIERGNEDWNFSFGPIRSTWADGTNYFASQGAAGFFLASGASITAGSRDITVGSGEGTNFTAGRIITAGDTFLGSVSSVSGDVVTIDRDHSLATGTYDVSTGPYEVRYDWYMMELERLRTNAELIFESTDDFVTIIATQRGMSVAPQYFTTPNWIAVDPDRPDPAARHDWFSVASYYDGGMSEAVVETYQTDPTQAAADFHASQMSAISTLSAELSSTRQSLDDYAPNLPIYLYEGGIHSFDSTKDDNWRTIAAVSFTNGSNTITVASDPRVRVGASVSVDYGDGDSTSDFVTTITAVSGTTVTLQDSFTGVSGSYSTTFRVYDNNDAIPLIEAWRSNATYQAEAQAAWWEAQKPMNCACQFLMLKKTAVSGSWGLRLTMTEADEYGAQILALAGQSLTASFGG